MRLICPNCDAEYEVEDSAIPDTGRDVQCSNCGHAWFQLPPEIELALEQEEELFGQAAAAADPAPAPDTPAPAEDEVLAAAVASAEVADVPSMASEAATPSDPPRRTLDDNLMAILREEAEREAAARRSEGSAIETQPDLGLAAPPAPPPSAPAPVTGGLAGAARRIAQMQGKDPDAPPPGPPRAAARRDLLPDIEEINSSLKGNEIPVEMGEGGQAVAAASEARGFRSGFALALFIAVILLAAYVAAPQIKAQLPAVAGSVDAYVAAVDGLRLWLDGLMRAATDTLRGMTAAQG